MTLKGGLIVPEAAVILILELDRRGHVCTAIDGLLRVTNKAALTTEDVAGIKRYRWHLLALANYKPPSNQRIVSRPIGNRQYSPVGV
jgi:hypothetical protein